MTRDEVFNQRLGSAVKEYLAARFCLMKEQKAAWQGATFLPSDRVSPSHVALCLKNLELTYTLRLFAEFEFVLREYLETISKPPTDSGGDTTIVRRPIE